MEESAAELFLSIQDADLTASRLDALTREMTVGLNRERGLQARAAEGEAHAGAKGDPMAVGTIVLQLLGSGGAIAVLLNGLKAYFLRKKTIVIDVKRKDGTKFTLRAENLSEQHMAQTTTQLLEFIKG